MDAIFCSSRGGGLSEPLLELHPYPSTVYLYSKGGGTLERLQHEAYSFLDNTLEPTNCHIYFVAGLCDVTYKDTDCEWGGYYEEVFYCESPWETVQRLGKLIDQISAHTLFYGAKPCFSTIIPCHLKTWNNIRLNQGKTNFLLHSNQYDHMQELLNQAIFEINRYIISTNESNNMATPFLAKTVVEHRGTKKPRVFYNRLPDGVHAPKPEYCPILKKWRSPLKEKWAGRLFHAIKINRKLQNPQENVYIPSAFDYEDI